jgi:hypothetical protein
MGKEEKPEKTPPKESCILLSLSSSYETLSIPLFSEKTSLPNPLRDRWGEGGVRSVLKKTVPG